MVMTQAMELHPILAMYIALMRISIKLETISANVVMLVMMGIFTVQPEVKEKLPHINNMTAIVLHQVAIINRLQLVMMRVVLGF